jgi:hypothetical protein
MSSIDSIAVLLYNVYQRLLECRASVQHSGEHFNIYKVLGLTTREVKLHSRLLAELLDPEGSHLLKDFFLKEFIATLLAEKKDIFKNLSTFETETANVKIEYHLGIIDLESNSGGRIDILIRDGQGMHIIIENKIYAGDQKDQLIRYNSINKKASLIYLTPDGRNPNSDAAGHLVKDKDFVCLSYASNILRWLQNCLDKLPNMTDSVRWSIIPYIWTLQTISQQSKYDNMANDIVAEMLASDETIISSFEIVNKFEKFKERRGEEIFTNMANAMAEKKWDCTVNRNYSITFPYMEVHPSSWKNHLIALTKDPILFLGIKRKIVNKPIQPKQIGKYMVGYKEYPWWLISKEFNESLFRLDMPEVWIRVNEQKVVAELLNTIEYFLSISANEPELPW